MFFSLGLSVYQTIKKAHECLFKHCTMQNFFVFLGFSSVPKAQIIEDYIRYGMGRVLRDIFSVYLSREFRVLLVAR